MDDQNRYEEIENKESVGTKIVKYFKGLGYDFIAGFKYNDMKLASWLIIIPGAIFGFFLHWHAKVCYDVNFNTVVPDPNNALKTLSYKNMSDLTGVFLFISMLCALLMIFLGFTLSSKKNLGTVISCTIATLLLIVFGFLYIYWIITYFGGVDAYMDKLDKAKEFVRAGGETDEKEVVKQAQILVGNKNNPEFYIGKNGIFSTKRASFDSNYIVSVGSIIFCVISSVVGCVLGFIKYDRTYQKVKR